MVLKYLLIPSHDLIENQQQKFKLTEYVLEGVTISKEAFLSTPRH
jgi:hypothetical protein